MLDEERSTPEAIACDRIGRMILAETERLPNDAEIELEAHHIRTTRQSPVQRRLGEPQRATVRFP